MKKLHAAFVLASLFALGACSVVTGATTTAAKTAVSVGATAAKTTVSVGTAVATQ